MAHAWNRQQPAHVRRGRSTSRQRCSTTRPSSRRSSRRSPRRLRYDTSWSSGRRAVSTPPSGKRLDMYERSLLHLAAKERHLQRTEAEMMEPCTFTPETNRTGASSHSTGSSVFDRLYANSKRQTPKKSNRQRHENKTSPTSLSSSGSNKSSPTRFEMLYQDAVRRNHNRKLTDKEEAKERQKRLEEEQLEKCTFKPNMDWRRKLRSPQEELKQNPKAPSKHDSNRDKSMPPVEIVTTKRAYPLPRKAYDSSDEMHHQLVSPLREPPSERVDGREALPSADGSIGEHTEYGSI